MVIMKVVLSLCLQTGTECTANVFPHTYSYIIRFTLDDCHFNKNIIYTS